MTGDARRVKRRFRLAGDADRRAHAITLNLARRQLGLVAWARMFSELLDARGVKTSPGPKGREDNAAPVAEIAAEAGVSERTARNRLKLARDLEPFPETAEKVDRGEESDEGARLHAPGPLV